MFVMRGRQGLWKPLRGDSRMESNVLSECLVKLSRVNVDSQHALQQIDQFSSADKHAFIHFLESLQVTSFGELRFFDTPPNRAMILSRAMLNDQTRESYIDKTKTTLSNSKLESYI